MCINTLLVCSYTSFSLTSIETWYINSGAKPCISKACKQFLVFYYLLVYSNAFILMHLHALQLRCEISGAFKCKWTTIHLLVLQVLVWGIATLAVLFPSKTCKNPFVWNEWICYGGRTSDDFISIIDDGLVNNDNKMSQQFCGYWSIFCRTFIKMYIAMESDVFSVGETVSKFSC